MMILLVGWGALLLGYDAYLHIATHDQVRWDGFCSLLAVLVVMSAIGGFVGNHLDYRSDVKVLRWNDDKDF
jgi:uncharacterized membrane protein YfcA